MMGIDTVQAEPPEPPEPLERPEPLPAPMAAPVQPASLPKGALGAWWWQGLRTAFFLRPQWAGLLVTPQLVAVMVMAGMAANVGLARLYIDGPATFYWASLITSGWFATALALWVCWLVTRQPRQEPPDMAALFALLVAQGLTFSVVNGLLMLPISRSHLVREMDKGLWFYWALWGVLIAWYATAQIRVLWLNGEKRWGIRLRAAWLILCGLTLQVTLQPPQPWYPVRPQQAAADASETPSFKLTQEVLEAQPRLLQTRLQALKAGAHAHGAPRLFAITFAPYADADVFARESKVVASVMQERFQTTGRTIQLINNRDTVHEWPWATPLNLQRAIERMAQLMNREDDVLFIHLTSHGARSGQLSADFEPLSIDPVTPQTLKQWLDKAGIRWRVISISACYSGSWIQPLSGDNTLVMTAADADHTSYGCGSRSTLTFFGRAMYDEQLRQTFSFEQAHAAARKVIQQREIEAGKTDGYSNPQIQVGSAVRGKLAALEATLRASPAAATQGR